jgi:hypothetical protein
MPASTGRLSGGLTGSGGPARENRLLDGRSKHKLNFLQWSRVHVGGAGAALIQNYFTVCKIVSLKKKDKILKWQLSLY